MTDAPRRTCVACREIRGKRELVRLVRRAEGIVVVDETGRTPGRGAYVCRGGGCAAHLVKGGRLSQAFRRPSKAEPALVTAVRAMNHPAVRVEAVGVEMSMSRSS